MVTSSSALHRLGDFGLFASAVLWRLATPPWSLREAARHLGMLFVRCALPVVAVVLPAGMVLALQGMQVFELFGAQRMLSSLVGIATFRELSPVLASVLVAAQGGSTFAAELGAMRINEELDATEVMAVDGLRVHVVPRVAAALLATPLLHLVGCFAGVFGGWIVAVLLQGESSGIYLDNLWALTRPIDLFGGLLKTLVFGGIIGLVACWQGFGATGGAPGVGRAVNDTVVLAVTSFVVANYFLSSALFGIAS